MPEFKFDPRSIGIAVITYYPKWYRGNLRSIKHTDKVRGDLALDFFRQALKYGYQIVCVDGGSPVNWRKAAGQILVKTFYRKKTNKRAPRKRLSMHIVSKLEGIRVIVITEPEKISLLGSKELNPFYQSMYIVESFLGIVLSALFITVMANLWFSER